MYCQLVGSDNPGLVAGIESGGSLVGLMLPQVDSVRIELNYSMLSWFQGAGEVALKRYNAFGVGRAVCDHSLEMTKGLEFLLPFLSF